MPFTNEKHLSKLLLHQNTFVLAHQFTWVISIFFFRLVLIFIAKLQWEQALKTFHFSFN